MKICSGTCFHTVGLHLLNPLSSHNDFTCHVSLAIWLIEVNSEKLNVGCLDLFVFFAVQIRGKTLTLCWPASVQGSCCTDMSHGPNAPEAPYGIINASVQNDLITRKTMSAYIFRGMTIDCSKGNGCYVQYICMCIKYKYRLCQRAQGLGLVPLQNLGQFK